MAREPRTTPAGVEDDDGEGYGEREGSESQGRFSGEGYGDDAQGEYGDEDGDPSYDADGEADGPVGQEVVERRAARRRTEGPPSDGSLEDEVVDRLVDVLGIDEQDVVVRVTDGVVELDGWVDTLALRDAAETEAANVPGVRGVENHLRQRRGTSEET